MFAGIGGFRLALQNLGGRCIFSSEYEPNARKTYIANYGEEPFGDITLEETKEAIPEKADILCAGFPCQAFSLAGKRLGFSESRGILFLDVVEILKRKQPKSFFLENVRGLQSHDKGRTLKIILQSLKDAGYTIPDPQVVNAMYFGVPQHRERLFIIGFSHDTGLHKDDFSYPEQKVVSSKFSDVKEKEPVAAKYYLSERYRNMLIAHRKRHEGKKNGFGYRIISDNGIANAVMVGGMGKDRNLVIDKRQTNLIPDKNIKGPYNTEGWRRMTPREFGALQGFPVYDNGDGKPVFEIPVSNTSAYKLFGNSVAIPAVEATARQILKTLGIVEK